MTSRAARKRRKAEHIAEGVAQSVLEEISAPLCGFDAPNYRGVLREQPEFTAVLLNTDDPHIFSPSTRRACRKDHLKYCAYRYGKSESCLIFVSPLRFPNIYEVSYKNLTEDTPLHPYKLIENCRNVRAAKRHLGFIEQIYREMMHAAETLRDLE